MRFSLEGAVWGGPDRFNESSKPAGGLGWRKLDFL